MHRTKETPPVDNKLLTQRIAASIKKYPILLFFKIKKKEKKSPQPQNSPNTGQVPQFKFKKLRSAFSIVALAFSILVTHRNSKKLTGNCRSITQFLFHSYSTHQKALVWVLLSIKMVHCCIH